MNIKIGDKVKVIGNESGAPIPLKHFREIGEVGYVTHVTTDKDHGEQVRIDDYQWVSVLDIQIIEDKNHYQCEIVMDAIQKIREGGVEWSTIKRAIQNVEDNENEEAGVRDAERKIINHYSA